MNLCAIDVGLKRVGVAIKLAKSSIVFPKEAIIRKNRNQASREVREFLDEWKIDKLIVGVPKSGKSSEEMKRRIEHFVTLIDFDKEIVFVDEDFSSFEAANITKGVFKHKKDGKIDSVAAKIILERYFESSNQNKSSFP